MFLGNSFFLGGSRLIWSNFYPSLRSGEDLNQISLEPPWKKEFPAKKTLSTKTIWMIGIEIDINPPPQGIDSVRTCPNVWGPDTCRKYISTFLIMKRLTYYENFILYLIKLFRCITKWCWAIPLLHPKIISPWIKSWCKPTILLSIKHSLNSHFSEGTR